MTDLCFFLFYFLPFLDESTPIPHLDTIAPSRSVSSFRFPFISFSKPPFSWLPFSLVLLSSWWSSSLVLPSLLSSSFLKLFSFSSVRLSLSVTLSSSSTKLSFLEKLLVSVTISLLVTTKVFYSHQTIDLFVSKPSLPPIVLIVDECEFDPHPRDSLKYNSLSLDEMRNHDS